MAERLRSGLLATDDGQHEIRGPLAVKGWEDWPDVLAENCPDCGKPAGQQCVYIWPKGIPTDPERLRWVTPAQREKAALTGQPTKRPHNGRLSRVHDRQRRRFQAEVRKSFQDSLVPASPQRRAAARAQREFDMREYEQMRAWLARNCWLLIHGE